MKPIIVALVFGSIAVGSAQAELLFSFETGLEGMHSSASLGLSATGATLGSQAMSVGFSGFHWIESDVSEFLATELGNATILAMDVTLVDSVGGWANTLISFNDATGWRQTAGTNLPTGPGTQTVLIDYSGLAAPNFAAGNWFKLSISVNAEQAGTYYIDNIHTVPEPASAAVIGLGVAGLALLRRRRAN